MKEKISKTSLYIHIPFCKRKCFYCDFNSYENKEDLISSYFLALKKEIDDTSKKSEIKSVDTIYIGGGTPSYVEGEYIAEVLGKIKNKFTLSDDCEITIELNPESINKEKVRLYKEIGINRISIGLQSLEDDILKKIGRVHTLKEFKDGLEVVKEAGFNNINVDLMFSLPSQSLKGFLEGAEYLSNLDIKHISLYSLILENHSKLGKYYEENNIIIDDELDRKMYKEGVNFLEKKGFIQYEISNFGKEGYYSRHNLNCWDFYDYIGFGAGAHSYVNGYRKENETDICKYIDRVTLKNTGVALEYKLEKEDKVKEYMMLSLRKIEGVIYEKGRDFLNIDIEKTFEKEIKSLEKDGFIISTKKGFFLSKKGLDFSNYVILKFFS